MVIRQAMAELRARLEAILQANGYRTDVGATLRDGFPRHLILHEQVDPPLLALHPTTDSADSANGRNIKSTRNVDAELIFDPYATDYAWDDEVLFDIRAALVGMERSVERVVTVATGDAQWQDIEDTHVVRMLVPIAITYTDTYGVEP